LFGSLLRDLEQECKGSLLCADRRFTVTSFAIPSDTDVHLLHMKRNCSQIIINNFPPPLFPYTPKVFKLCLLTPTVSHISVMYSILVLLAVFKKPDLFHIKYGLKKDQKQTGM